MEGELIYSTTLPSAANLPKLPQHQEISKPSIEYNNEKL